MHWVERLTLTNFRNYAHLVLDAGPEPQVLIGANGAGKTNLLEAVSLLAPGHGLRRATYPELARAAGDGGWAVAAHVHAPSGPVDIGTGLTPAAAQSERGSRIVRINGAPAGGSGVLAEYVELVWVTPALELALYRPRLRAPAFPRPPHPLLRHRLPHARWPLRARHATAQPAARRRRAR